MKYKLVCDELPEAFYCEEPKNKFPNHDWLKESCERYIRSYHFTTPYGVERTVVCKIYALDISEKGQLKERFVTNKSVAVPYARMTQDEYSKEMSCILNGLRPSFIEFISNYAYSHGHSSGYEEVVNIAREMAYDLKEACKKENI